MLLQLFPLHENCVRGSELRGCGSGKMRPSKIVAKICQILISVSAGNGEINLERPTIIFFWLLGILSLWPHRRPGRAWHSNFDHLISAHSRKKIATITLNIIEVDPVHKAPMAFLQSQYHHDLDLDLICPGLVHEKWRCVRYVQGHALELHSRRVLPAWIKLRRTKERDGWIDLDNCLQLQMSESL